jgi:hypothetical protein
MSAYMFRYLKLPENKAELLRSHRLAHRHWMRLINRVETLTGSKAYCDHLGLPREQRPGSSGNTLSCIVSQSGGVSVATQPSPLCLISIHEPISSDIGNAGLTFIVSVQSSCIVDDWHVCVNIPGCIAGPNVAVDETRLYLAATGL